MKRHRAARWIGFAEPATPWQCLSELRLLIWLKRWINRIISFLLREQATVFY